jgi:hypothetical protein
VRLELLEMPTREELQRAIAASTEEYMRERLRRKLGLRETVGDGSAADFPYLIWQLGDAFIVALPAEAHSPFQMALRQRFPHNHIAVLNIANGYLSYIPPPAEEILGSVTQTIEQLLEKSAARSR